MNQNEFWIGQKQDILQNSFFERIKWNSSQMKLYFLPEQTNLTSLSYFTFEADIAHIFGYPTGQTIHLYSNELVEATYQGKFSPVGDVILVYCDITENKVLKGPDENLLKVICIGDKSIPFGSVFFQEVKNPSYLPINTRYLTTMKFFLRDAYGRKVLFVDGPHTVQLQLRFRPVKPFDYV